MPAVPVEVTAVLHAIDRLTGALAELRVALARFTPAPPDESQLDPDEQCAGTGSYLTAMSVNDRIVAECVTCWARWYRVSPDDRAPVHRFTESSDAHRYKDVP